MRRYIFLLTISKNTIWVVTADGNRNSALSLIPHAMSLHEGVKLWVSCLRDRHFCVCEQQVRRKNFLPSSVRELLFES